MAQKKKLKDEKEREAYDDEDMIAPLGGERDQDEWWITVTWGTLLIKCDHMVWRIQIQDVWWKVGIVVVFGWDLGRIKCDSLLCWI